MVLPRVACIRWLAMFDDMGEQRWLYFNDTSSTEAGRTHRGLVYVDSPLPVAACLKRFIYGLLGY